LKAILKRQYDQRQKAEAILQSVQPDNLKAPDGIRITSTTEGISVKIVVECSKGIGAFISTIDDLLSCMGAAERTLDALD
jgi:transcription factor Pcc1